MAELTVEEPPLICSEYVRFLFAHYIVKPFSKADKMDVFYTSLADTN
jgi:hypothetical protein